MRFILGSTIVLICMIGCKQPVQVCTNSQLSFAEPMSANVTAHMGGPVRGPLYMMPVDGGPGCLGSQPKIALIDVDGLLVNTKITGPYAAGENPVALFHEKLDAAARDPSICAVVLRINTYGGGVAASDLMWQQLQKFRRQTGLPVVASLMDVATGGGYFVATAADHIVALPTTVTGGIGVILNHYWLFEAMAQQNVFHRPIKAGENIDMGSCSVEIMPPKVRQMLEDMAEQYHAHFVQTVLSSRPVVQSDDFRIFDGRVFTARQAVERGLVDQVGYLEDAIHVARQRGGRNDARVVMFRRETDPARSPFDVTSHYGISGNLLPLSIPGFERSKLPKFLYLWQVEPTMEVVAGR